MFKLTKDSARLLGHLFFDGSVGVKDNGCYWFNYSNASQKSVHNFIRIAKKTFNLNSPRIRKYSGNNGNYYQVTFYSKKVISTLLNISPTFSTSKNVKAPNIILDAPNNIKAQFLKAFWDDEGCITTDRLRIHGALLSENMIDNLIRLHLDLNISTSKWRNNSNHSYFINLLNFKDNVNRFSKLIGFEFGLITKGKSKGYYKNDLLIKKLDKINGTGVI